MKTYTKIKIAASLLIILMLAILCGINAIPRLDAIANDTLLKSGAPIAPEIIIIGMDILFTEESDEAEDEALMEAIAYAGNVVLPMQADIRVGQESRLGPDGLLLAHGAIYPIPMLAAQALDFGHINALPDER